MMVCWKTEGSTRGETRYNRITTCPRQIGSESKGGKCSGLENAQARGQCQDFQRAVEGPEDPRQSAEGARGARGATGPKTRGWLERESEHSRGDQMTWARAADASTRAKGAETSSWRLAGSD